MNQSVITSFNAPASSWIDGSDLSLRPCCSPALSVEEERKVTAGLILGLEPSCSREHPVHHLAFYSFIAYFRVKPGAVNLS